MSWRQACLSTPVGRRERRFHDILDKEYQRAQPSVDVSADPLSTDCALITKERLFRVGVGATAATLTGSSGESPGSETLPRCAWLRLSAMAELSGAELDALVEQATVDAYDEYEQRSGFHVMLKEHLAVPFETNVPGVEVTVKKIDLRPGSGLVAICVRGRHRQVIGLLDLPFPLHARRVLSGSTLTGAGTPERRQRI